MDGWNYYPPTPQSQMSVIGDHYQWPRPMNKAAVASFVLTALSAMAVALAWLVVATATADGMEGAGIGAAVLYMYSLGGCLIAVVLGLVAFAERRRTRGLGWGIASLVISGPWLVYLGGTFLAASHG